MFKPIDIEEGEYEDDTMHWTVCGFRVATLEFTTEEPGEGWDRCGNIRVMRPAFQGDHEDIAILRAILGDMEAHLKAWVEDGRKPDFGSGDAGDE